MFSFLCTCVQPAASALCSYWGYSGDQNSIQYEYPTIQGKTTTPTKIYRDLRGDLRLYSPYGNFDKAAEFTGGRASSSNGNQMLGPSPIIVIPQAVQKAAKTGVAIILKAEVEMVYKNAHCVADCAGVTFSTCYSCCIAWTIPNCLCAFCMPVANCAVDKSAEYYLFQSMRKKYLDLAISGSRDNELKDYYVFIVALGEHLKQSEDWKHQDRWEYFFNHETQVNLAKAELMIRQIALPDTSRSNENYIEALSALKGSELSTIDTMVE